MAINRRRFIELAGLVTGTSVPSALAAIQLDDSQYTNRLLNIRFSKPEGWYFTSLLDIELALEEFETELDDATERELKAESDRPLVVMTKYREPYQKLNPAISFYFRSFDRFYDSTDLLKCVQTDVDNVLEQYPSGFVVRRVRQIRVGSIRASAAAVQFDFNTSYGLCAKMVCEIVDIPRRTGILQFICASAPRGTDNSYSEFQHLLSTIE